MPEWNTQFFSLDNILFPFGHFELLTNTSLSVYNEIKISIEKSIIHEMVDLKMIEIRPNRIKPKVIILRGLDESKTKQAKRFKTKFPTFEKKNSNLWHLQKVRTSINIISDFLAIMSHV